MSFNCINRAIEHSNLRIMRFTNAVYTIKYIKCCVHHCTVRGSTPKQPH